MRISNLSISIALALGLSLNGAAVPGAYAQTASSITCGEFMKMSPSAQSAALKRVAASVPPPSLSASPLSPSQGNNQNRAIRPRNAGQLVAACQAVSPVTTVRNAYMRALPSSTSSR
ncbi:MAG TPA: hypothetical protein VL418_12035 [Devosiaceae bacterium]|nr:hypothetical protein [Devosiaceae bacterium]